MVSATIDEEGSDSHDSSTNGEGGGGGERGGGGEAGQREVFDGDKADSGWVTATLERLGSGTEEESKTSEEKGGGLDEKEKELDEDASEHGG